MSDEKIHTAAFEGVFDQLLQHFGSSSSPYPNIDNPHKPHAIHHTDFERHFSLSNIIITPSSLYLINELPLQIIEGVAKGADESCIVLAAVKFNAHLMIPLETALTLNHVTLGFAVAETIGR